MPLVDNRLGTSADDGSRLGTNLSGNMECCLIPCCALIRFTVMWLTCQSKASWMNFLWLIWFVCCLHHEALLGVLTYGNKSDLARSCWDKATIFAQVVKPELLAYLFDVAYVPDVGVSKLFACERFVYSIIKITIFYDYQLITHLWGTYEVCKGMWDFWLCFSGADWLGRQTLITWPSQWQENCVVYYPGENCSIEFNAVNWACRLTTPEIKQYLHKKQRIFS